MEESQISKYYSNKKVLITGGTGFLGKVLLWKLLQSCSMIDTIYMLIRTKHGKSSASRRDELFNYVIFDQIKKNYPKVHEKVIIINGDVGEEGLGLSDKDRDTIINEVSVVFHSAAVLKMDAPLKYAVNVNTKGTLRILQLAEQMKKLEAFVYISTAYCCCENRDVEEKLYPAKDNPYDVINLTQWMSEDLLETIKPKLIDPLPNTYTYSKRLAEALLCDFQSKLPLIVSRPTIVTPAYKEPIPGWVDNLNGPVGLFTAAGVGILQITMTNENAESNVIPVDRCVNGILALPSINDKESLMKRIAVYNIGQTEYRPITWMDITIAAINTVSLYPLDEMLWYPSKNVFTNSIVVYTIKDILFHWIPAYIIDLILFLIGRKPVLVRIQTKRQQGEKVLRYFARRQWDIHSDKIIQIHNSMNKTDQQKFPLTLKDVGDLNEYIANTQNVTRHYLFKENPKRLGFARKKARVMYYLDKFMLIVKYIVYFKILMYIVNLFLNLGEFYHDKFNLKYNIVSSY